MTITESADTITFDATEAQTLDNVADLGATTDQALTTGGIIVGDGNTVGATTTKWLFDDTNGDISTTGNVGIGTTAPNQKLTIEGTLSLKEQASANADTVAYGQLWVKTATPNELWFTDDGGTDTQLGQAGGAGDLLADGSVPLTADWDVGAYDITAVEFKGALKGNADTVTNGVYTTDFPLNQSTTGSAATLTTPRAINGVDFDGSAPITVTAAAGTLTGATLKADVLASSLTSVGTITSLVATTADINAGTFDGVVGGTTPADGSFSTLSASGLISADGGQIKFPATQSASADANTLDDYEEGYHIATITCETSGGYTLNAAQNTLAYTKVGRVVHIQGLLVVASADSPSGSLNVSLPFAVAELTELSERFTGHAFLYNHGGTIPNGVSANGEAGWSYVRLLTLADNGTYTSLSNTSVDTAWALYVNFSYIAAS